MTAADRDRYEQLRGQIAFHYGRLSEQARQGDGWVPDLVFLLRLVAEGDATLREKDVVIDTLAAELDDAMAELATYHDLDFDDRAVEDVSAGAYL